MKRMLAFYEIGTGKFAQECQAQFEECQQLALQSKQAISMTMKIVIEPPPDGDRFGKTQYSVTHSNPVTKSIKYTTEYEAGVAIKDGENIDGVLQQDLFIKENHN